MPNKAALTVRQPLGVAGLIIAANTPIANVAWKVFPALLCGNAAVLKAAEDTPLSAWAVRPDRARGGPAGRRAQRGAGLGEEAGAPLVEHPRRRTSSASPARPRSGAASRRPPARGWPRSGSSSAARTRSSCATTPISTRPSKRAVLSAFSNAGPALRRGQPHHRVRRGLRAVPRRAASRATATLRVGPGRRRRLRAGDQRAPAREHARRGRRGASAAGRRVLTGGTRLDRPGLRRRLLPGADAARERVARRRRSRGTELFGPIAMLYRVPDFEAALALANDSPVRPHRLHPHASVHRAHDVRSAGCRPAWRWSTAAPTAASRTCRSAA